MTDSSTSNNEPSLPSQIIRTLDRKTIEDWGIPGLILMENAGQKAADFCLQIMAKSSLRTCLLFAGSGNNAGDAFVVARHLAIHGIEARIILAGDASTFTRDSDAGKNLQFAKDWGIEVINGAQEGFRQVISSAVDAALLVDGLLGTGAKGAPRDPISQCIQAMNQAKAPILALDLPSGLNADTGEVEGACIHAQWTITFGVMKQGLQRKNGPRQSGQVKLARISIPPCLIEQAFLDQESDKNTP